LGRRGKKALILTEGLLTYLSAEEVAGLAQDPGGTSKLSFLDSRHGVACIAANAAKAAGAQLETSGAVQICSRRGTEVFRKVWLEPRRGALPDEDSSAYQTAAAFLAALFLAARYRSVATLAPLVRRLYFREAVDLNT
jgi:hypothetical protein